MVTTVRGDGSSIVFYYFLFAPSVDKDKGTLGQLQIIYVLANDTEIHTNDKTSGAAAASSSP